MSPVAMFPCLPRQLRYHSPLKRAEAVAHLTFEREPLPLAPQRDRWRIYDADRASLSPGGGLRQEWGAFRRFRIHRRSFSLLPRGSDFQTIGNVQEGACLTYGGSDVDIGQGTDTLAITASGSGWTVKNTDRNVHRRDTVRLACRNIPMSSTAVALTISVP